MRSRHCQRRNQRPPVWVLELEPTPARLPRVTKSSGRRPITMHGPTPRSPRGGKRLLLSLLLPCSVLLWVLPAAAAQASTFDDALARGPLVLALSAFGFGALVSLTPCVYPMVAITVSVFGATNAKSRLQSFALSAAFVLG